MRQANFGAVRPFATAAVLALFAVSVPAQVVEKGRTLADLIASHPCDTGLTNRIARVTDCDSATDFGDGDGAFQCWAYCDGSAPWTNLSIGGGPATTATALAADGGNCSAGQYPLGVDAAGAVQTCTADDDVPEVGDYSNLVAGRSLTAPSAGTVDADAELYTHTKCMTIETPATGDDFLFFRAETAITVTGIDCLVADGTSVGLLVKECNSNGGACGNTEASITCGTTNTTEATSIDDSAVDAGDWMRIDPGTNTGTVTQMSVCVTFTVND